MPARRLMVIACTVNSTTASIKTPGEWKTLYRLGKAPTMAALDFARAWVKEL